MTMTMRNNLVLAVAMLGGCVTAPGDGGPSEIPRLTGNALMPAQLAETAVTTAVLDATSAAAMTPSLAAVKVLDYAVGCALASTQSITFTTNGSTYTVAGEMGIAPGWVTAGLSPAEASWVSACVLSRVNFAGVMVSISDRGAATGLDASAAELAGYQVEEGAFWGNVFADLGPLAPYSCDGVDQAANDTYGDLPLRQCAQPDGVPGSNLSPCGMHYAGLCSDVCATSAPYAGCVFPGETAADSVVTTFLAGTPQ